MPAPERRRQLLSGEASPSSASDVLRLSCREEEAQLRRTRRGPRAITSGVQTEDANVHGESLHPRQRGQFTHTVCRRPEHDLHRGLRVQLACARLPKVSRRKGNEPLRELSASSKVVNYSRFRNTASDSKPSPLLPTRPW